MNTTLLDAWINLFKDGFTALSVPATAFIAIRGLNTWQRQMKGTAEFELMRNVLRAVYKVRDTLRTARSPAFWTGEGDDVNIEDPNAQLTQADKARISRWNKVSEAVTELAVVMNEAEVVWGAVARQKLLLLNKSYISLGSALTTYRELRQNQPHGEQERKAMVELNKIICQPNFNEDADDFDRELNNSINQIETYVRSKVK